jgi:cell wall-associated NlpC family hydrolase
MVASEMVGTPYRLGGETPRGFDCSGLVHYAYGQAGVSVPRLTREQYKGSRRVSLDQLQPGDLVFFRIRGGRLSHVGIYAGDGRFIHAPSRGKRVRYARLDNPYWRKRWVGAGRF